MLIDAANYFLSDTTGVTRLSFCALAAVWFVLETKVLILRSLACLVVWRFLALLLLLLMALTEQVF